jgi:tetratricopeptide (TPR) repeat protein
VLNRSAAGGENELTAVDQALLSAPANLGPKAAQAVVDLLSRKASIQAALGRRDDAIETLDDLASRFSPPRGWELAHAVGWALMTRCKLLLSAGRDEEAHRVSEELLALFAEQDGSRDLGGFGEMLVEVGGAFSGRHDYERALFIWRATAARLRDASTAHGEVVAAKAMLLITTALHNLHRPDAAESMEAFCAKGQTALTALDELIDKHPPRPGSPTAGFLEIARILILVDLGRRSEADDMLEELDLGDRGPTELKDELMSQLRLLLT